MEYKEACSYFPGGTQLLSKRPINNKYPYQYQSAKGIEIKSNDKIYIDFTTMGIGSCILGYSNSDINTSIINSVNNGNMSSINSCKEIQLAKILRKYEPKKMFRYFRTGGEAMSGAIRTVRTYTGKSIILTNGYNGWHDWYLAANQNEGAKNHLNINTCSGVPIELTGTCYYFDTIEKLKKLIFDNKNEIAGIVIELARYKTIDIEIIEYLKKANIPVIVDEITTGWRNNLGGMYRIFKGFNPDIVVYGKAISNGYSFSVICGKSRIMKAINNTFISSTYWTESIGTTAAIATINQLEIMDYEYRNKLEKVLRDGLEKIFGATDGFNGMIHYYPKNKNKWVNYMLKNNYLVTDQIYLSFAHSNLNILNFLEIASRFKNV